MALLVLATMTIPAPGQETVPGLSTNQIYIEQVLSPATLNVSDALSVLSYILTSLPDEVVVHPTENYYYFSFFLDGLKYSGNLRLDASDRDNGKIHLAYFSANSEWGKAQEVTALLSRTDLDLIDLAASSARPGVGTPITLDHAGLHRGGIHWAGF